MKKSKLTIQGMHCGSCAGNIERALKIVIGVKTAAASLMTHKCIVETDDIVSEEDMKKAVARAGYKVVAVESL